MGLAGDVLILVPTSLLGVGMIGFGMTPNCTLGIFGDGGCTGPPDGGIVALGVAVTALAITPLAVDLATKEFYEFVPREITAEFE